MLVFTSLHSYNYLSIVNIIIISYISILIKQRGIFLVTFDAENDRPGPGSLRGHFEAARGHLRVCPEWPAMPCMEWLPALGIQG